MQLEWNLFLCLYQCRMIGKRRLWRVSPNCIIMIVIVTIHNFLWDYHLWLYRILLTCTFRAYINKPFYIFSPVKAKTLKATEFKLVVANNLVGISKTEVRCSLLGRKNSIAHLSFVFIFLLFLWLFFTFSFQFFFFFFGSGEGRSMCRLQNIRWLGQSRNESDKTKNKNIQQKHGMINVLNFVPNKIC